MTTEITIDTGTDELLCVIRDRVAIITLNRPRSAMRCPDNLTPALRTMIKTCGENPDVGALLITGAGTAFCAGGNVKGMGAHRDKKKLEMSYDEKVADLQERQRLLTGALVSVRKPTIAALPGPAVGAGLRARDGLRHPHRRAIGVRLHRLSAGGALRRLRHRLAADAAGRHVAGARTDVHRREGRCGADARRSASSTAWCRTTSCRTKPLRSPNRWRKGRRWRLRYMKDNLDEALLFDFATARDHEAERLVRLTTTADHKEAVQAFIDKRKPVFKGG